MLEKPHSITDLALFEVKIPIVNIRAPFIVLAMLIGSAAYIFVYNKNRRSA